MSSLHLTARKRKKKNTRDRLRLIEWKSIKRTVMWCDTRHRCKPTNMFVANIFEINSIEWFNFIFLLNREKERERKKVLIYPSNFRFTSNSIFFRINSSAVWVVLVTIIELSLIKCIFVLYCLRDLNSSVGSTDWIEYEVSNHLKRKTKTPR